MKHIQTLVFMTLCGVALIFANNASAQSTKQGTATVVRIQGEARYSTGDNVWHPLVAGKILGVGAVIQTAVDSKVDLVLGEVPVQVAYPNSESPISAAHSLAADPNVRGYVVFNAKALQNVIRMYGNTVLAIDKLNFSDTGADSVGDTELDLRAGKIFGSVKKLSAMSLFEVKIPNGIAGIRGTQFTIEADGAVVVFSGSVTVYYSYVYNNVTYTVSQTVGQGQQFTPDFNGPPAGQPVDVSPDALWKDKQAAIAADTLYDQSEHLELNNGVTIFVTPVCGGT
jgi:FecR-like protein